MSTRSDDIQRRLTTCSEALRTPGLDPRRRQTLTNLADDLLDERNALLGVPRIAATRPCDGCWTMRPTHTVTPVAPHARAVNVVNCPDCDRVRCTTCKTPITDITAHSCPAGHHLAFKAHT